MTIEDQNIIISFANNLRATLPDAEVYAFGSRVNGTCNEESDLDICVVVPVLNHAAREIIRDVAWRVGYDNDVVITTVKYEAKAFRHGAISASPLVQTIVSKGMAA